LEFDLIINFEGYSQYWNRVLSSIDYIPKVLYLHNDMLSEAKVKYPYLYGNFKIYEKYDRLISVSKDSHLINQNSLNIDRNRFEYSINPLNIKDILSKSKLPIDLKEKNLFENSQVFINIARLSPEKGQIKLIKAFHKLSKIKSSIKLLILGEGPLKDEINDLIVTLSLENRVFLLGHKVNPMSYLKASDCFVLSSNHEGQGLVILEAMILKKYIISTDIDGPRELLKDSLGDLVENSEDGLYYGMLTFLKKPLTLKYFDMKKYNQDAINMFNNKVLTLIDTPKDNLNQLYQSAIKDFNNKNWKNSFDKFINIRSRSKSFSTLYYIKESRIRDLIENENKNIDDILIYFNHKFDSENFAGILFMLSLAKDNSLKNSNSWESLYLSFLPIIEYIKKIDGTLDDLLDKNFLIKVDNVSKKFTNSLESNLLPYQVWFVFANIFILIRDYKQYQLARLKALESVSLTQKIPKVGFARYKINAMAELNQEVEYDNLREKLLKRDENYLKQHLLLLGNTELYFNRQQSVVNFYKKQYTSTEKIFENYIKGKSIAIVGPVDSGLNLGEEIDSYDVVLRFNYMGMSAFSKSSFGERTDISFYISQLLLRNNIDTKTVTFMNKLDWIIVDTEHKESDVCFSGVKRPLRQRFYAGHPHINPFFKGTPSGIQRAIMDLLRFDIGKLKVFNTNLFLENNYAKAYKSHGKSGIDYFNFIRHDPLSNFIFLKRLKEFEILETDSVLNRVLEMSEKEYIEALELQYGYKK
jgi:glycosyltransferase involved in cell wall biosynthesis